MKLLEPRTNDQMHTTYCIGTKFPQSSPVRSMTSGEVTSDLGAGISVFVRGPGASGLVRGLGPLAFFRLWQEWHLFTLDWGS